MSDEAKPGSIEGRRRKLATLARNRHGKLTAGEVKLLRAVVAGEMADLSPGQTPAGGNRSVPTCCGGC